MSFLDHGYQPENCADCTRCPFREQLAEKYGGWLAVPIAVRAAVECDNGITVDRARYFPDCGDSENVQRRVQAVEQLIKNEAAVNE